VEERLKEAIGRNLKTAREAAGKSQEEFAGELGISRATLSGFENGHVAIDSAKLLRASKILGLPVTDFFTDREEEMALLFRAAEEVVPKADVRSRLRRFCEAYRELEEIAGVADAVLLPPEYTYFPHLHSKYVTFATQVALSERERLGVGLYDPIENIFKLLDENGVRLLDLTIDQDELFGLSGFSKRYGLCILVNTRNTLERNIFTAAHEYGHLLMHRPFYRNVDLQEAAERDPELEEMADVFAANFLVPEFGLRDVWAKNAGRKEVKLEDLVFLKHHFRVSTKVIVRRLKDIGLISEKESDELMVRAYKAQPDEKVEYAPLKNEKIDLIAEWKTVSRFLYLARKAALAGHISIGKLGELMGKNVLEARSLVQQWRKELAVAPA
jgi:Zn-dependent peptidase ImmA (M78 family)/transcriptional regulator with XRE-family HTH domain